MNHGIAGRQETPGDVGVVVVRSVDRRSTDTGWPDSMSTANVDPDEPKFGIVAEEELAGVDAETDSNGTGFIVGDALPASRK